ncbi:hypothetical protein DFH08DRAFT_956879 [Mycena albidolilacea]|uniref:Heme haloperoxidase family profile domain-containing protein n=1 Tax=Mycena albidolilacea TaxID=1033008 RepID=A0AAD7A8K6_9AGAR|nr:hypothetical protein DFH08DRAFT_956879 [Mycena albidolilacea]
MPNPTLSIFDIFRLGPDIGAIAGILALYGANLPDIPFFEFSVGEPPGGIRGLLGLPILGLQKWCSGQDELLTSASDSEGGPSGLSATHNQFESDSSATRCDLYQRDAECHGDNYSVQPPLIQALFDLIEQKQNTISDLEIIFEHRLNTLRHSKECNPYFFYGPIEMMISCVTHNLIFGLLANHSAANPDGFLSVDGLSSLYGVTCDDDGKLRYTRNERIPESWYRRSSPYFGTTNGIADLLRM